jgi:hypothetical protein
MGLGSLLRSVPLVRGKLDRNLTMPNDSTTFTVCSTVILLAVLAGIFALAWHGIFTGAEVFGLVTSIIGIAGGAFAVHSGVKAGGRATAIGAERGVTRRR